MRHSNCTGPCAPHRGRVRRLWAVRWWPDGEGFGIKVTACEASVAAKPRLAFYDLRGRLVREATADA